MLSKKIVDVQRRDTEILQVPRDARLSPRKSAGHASNRDGGGFYSQRMVSAVQAPLRIVANCFNLEAIRRYFESMHLDGFWSVLCSSHFVDQKLGQRSGSEHEYPMTAATNTLLRISTNQRLRGNHCFRAGRLSMKISFRYSSRHKHEVDREAEIIRWRCCLFRQWRRQSCTLRIARRGLQVVNLQRCISLAIKDDSREICSCID